MRNPYRVSALVSALSLVLAAALLGPATPASAQIGVFNNTYARECFLQALADRANSAPCDRALETEMLTGRDLAATYVNRAVIRTNAGRYKIALSDLERAEALKPELGEIHTSRGNVFYYMNDFEEALKHYDRGIEAGMEKLHAAHYDRGLALEQLGRVEESKDAFRKALAIEPEFELARMRLIANPAAAPNSSSN
jgi:tetratricopeptide (TPR) repeat protein